MIAFGVNSGQIPTRNISVVLACTSLSIASETDTIFVRVAVLIRFQQTTAFMQKPDPVVSIICLPRPWCSDLDPTQRSNTV